MAVSYTFDSIKDLIKSYQERTDTDFENRIPYFIDLAQRRISKDILQLGLQTYITGSFIRGANILPKPSFWITPLSFSYGYTDASGANKIQVMELRSNGFCRSYWPDETLQDKPKYYADYGYNFYLISPTPDYPYKFEFAYCGLANTIDENNQTNWITEFAPNVIIYAAMLEAQVYLKNDERTKYYTELYAQSLRALDTIDSSRLVDRSQDTRKG